MKRTAMALILALTLSLGLCVSASAAEYIPDDVTYQNLNGQQLAIKVFTLLPDQDPSSLAEEDFEYDGFLYSHSSTVKEEQTYNEQNLHTETVTITTSTKNLEDILAELKPTIEYDDGVASGTLALDHSTIKTEAAGYKNSSYTVTATKNYTGLDRNDSSYIDKTVVKNGRTLSLSNVTWSVESTALVGDELVPATYTAVATYSGTAYSSVATGYITTADYTGTVTASGMQYRRSFSSVARPTYSKSDAGSGHTCSRKVSGRISVTASGFFISEPSFAKILLKLTPMDTVKPTSAFTVSRISFAISTGVRFFRSGEPVREIQLSSIPKDSTSGEYRR